MLIISPFTRGGFISSDLFDHTSLLRFLETRFGAEVPNLSAWRRATVGDMTSAFNFTKPDTSIPPLPPTVAATSSPSSPNAPTTSPDLQASPFPVTQTMPTQESGSPFAPAASAELNPSS